MIKLFRLRILVDLNIMPIYLKPTLLSATFGMPLIELGICHMNLCSIYWYYVVNPK